MSFSDYQAHLFLEQIQVGFVAAHFDNPIHAGSYASEISGDGYVRQAIQFNEPSNRTMWNVNVVQFAGMPASEIKFLAGWDARIQGNLTWWVELPEPRRVLQGGGWSIQPNDIAVSFA